MSGKSYNIWEQGQQDDERSSGKNDVPRGGRISSGLDINPKRVLSVWPLAIVLGLIGFMVGSIYLRYVDIVYSVSASVNIEERVEVSIGAKFFGSQRDPFNDKIAFLRSPAFGLRLVDTLGLNYHSMSKGRFKDKEYYGALNWSVIGYDSTLTASGKNNPDGLSFTINTERKGFNYSYGPLKGEGYWGAPFNLAGRFIQINKVGEVPAGRSIILYTTNPIADAFRISKEIKVTSNASTNVINISYSDQNSKRAIDILNNAISLYNNIIEREKSMSFKQAIDFIDNRIIPLGRELDSIETSLANYKSARGFVGNTANGPQYLTKVAEKENQLNQINLLKLTITEVEQFIESPFIKDENVFLMGITDPVLQGNARAYQEARKERDRIAAVQTPNSPSLILAEKQLKQIRSNIDVQLVNYKKQLAIIEANYQKNLSIAEAMLRATPMQEKELLGKQRMMTIKENLFLNLLQKKEEAAIAKASITIDTKVLNPPAIINAIQSPSKSQVLAISILSGLVLPFLFALLKEVLNKQIITKKQLQAISLVPVVAELEETSRMDESPFVIDRTRRSMFGEQIRTLRTNLNFYNLADKPTVYILFTSSVSGEGKTFLSINLAKSYSLQGKRVALLEFDLRRPKISKAFNYENKQAGLSSLLIGKCEPPDIIYNCVPDSDETLDLFVSGPIPPNPQELISTEYMKKLKKYLDDNYDVVVIDTPPFGLVADAQILGKWADLTLIVTRYQQTYYEQVNEINDWYQNRAFKNMGLILNGVRSSGYFGNRYGYNYYRRRKYGYGNGYYSYGYGGYGYGSNYYSGKPSSAGSSYIYGPYRSKIKSLWRRIMRKMKSGKKTAKKNNES